MTLYYTGVGSRETPDEVRMLMRVMARTLGEQGYVLRSGAAQGADAAFERGAAQRGFRRDIYLPWRGFNEHTSQRFTPSMAAYALARTVHPKWSSLTHGARALHARNCHQVLGDDLKTPSMFLLCWTADGCESEKDRTKDTGGTATAIVLAERHGIPIFNLRNPDWKLRLDLFV